MNHQGIEGAIDCHDARLAVGFSTYLMFDDDSFEWLVQQLRLMSKRIERCEGKIAQLEAQSIQPGLMFPSRHELQKIDDRVKKLENEK